MKTGLTKKQKTTSIFFTDADDMIEVCTHNTPLKNSLAAFAAAADAGYGMELDVQLSKDGEVVVFVHTNFQKKIVSEHYADKLKDAFENVLGILLIFTALVVLNSRNVKR